MNNKSKDQIELEAYKFVKSLREFDELFDKLSFKESDDSPEMKKYEKQYNTLLDQYGALDVRGKRAVYDMLNRNHAGRRLLKEYPYVITYQR